MLISMRDFHCGFKMFERYGFEFPNDARKNQYNVLFLLIRIPKNVF